MDTGIIDEKKESSLSEYREKIFALEEELKKYKQEDLKTNHHFGGGVYARELIIPEGTVLTGKMHKHEHLNIMLYGDITVATETGDRRISEPCVILSKPGTKRAGYAHSDTVWITLHATPETNLETLEKIFIVDNPQEYLEEQKKLETK